jgi:Ca2+-binding EF-hand superfamily protein
MKPLAPLFAACLLSLAATGAAAQATGPRPPQFDLNRDGKVTLAEFKLVQVDGLLKRLDANHDGRIAAVELRAAGDRAKAMGSKDAADRARSLQARLDSNGDGMIIRAELEASIARRFGLADSNSDGWLSKGELLSMRQNRTREN